MKESYKEENDFSDHNAIMDKYDDRKMEDI